jgi:hypothetical protein
MSFKKEAVTKKMYSFKEGLKMSIDFNTATTLFAMMALLGVILSVAYQT